MNLILTFFCAWFGLNAIEAAYHMGKGGMTCTRGQLALTVLFEIGLFILAIWELFHR